MEKQFCLVNKYGMPGRNKAEDNGKKNYKNRGKP